jgi:uncharacterized protein (TIGR03067 family)
MRGLCSVFLAFAMLITLGCKPKSSRSSSDPKELEQLRGTWNVIAIVAAGNPVAQDRVQKIALQYIFDGNKITVHRPDRPDNVGTFSVDTSTNPKRMTLNLGIPGRAVYSLDGNKLQLCMMVDDNPNAGFPAALASTASPKADLLTLERH